MLTYQPAFLVKEKFLYEYARAITNKKLTKYFSIGYTSYVMDIPDSDWSNIVYAIMNGDNIVGFLSAHLNRGTYGKQQITNICIMSFNKDINILLCVKTIIDELLKTFYKITFNVIIRKSIEKTNPLEQFYDKTIKRYNGRIVGTRINDGFHIDGDVYDSKIYEIFSPNIKV